MNTISTDFLSKVLAKMCNRNDETVVCPKPCANLSCNGVWCREAKPEEWLEVFSRYSIPQQEKILKYFNNIINTNDIEDATTNIIKYRLKQLNRNVLRDTFD